MGQAKRGRSAWWVRASGAFSAALLMLMPAARAQRLVMNGQMAMSEMDGVAGEDAPKTNGFSIKKEDQKLIEQFDDFERFKEKKAWDRAFKALDALAGASDNMAPTKEGFWIQTRQKFLRSLLSLPPEGKEAYRLFNDAKAKQLWEQALAHETAGDADTIALLKKAVDQFFITSVGDKAADHLGDALFESGDYTGAAKAWEQILSFYPESSLPALRLQMKRATALARAGRWEQFRQLSASIREKHAGETVKIAGKDLAVEEQLASLQKPTTAPTTNASGALADDVSPLKLPTEDHPLWQMQFMDQAMSDKIFSQLNQNGWGQQMAPMAHVVPAAVADGKRVYLNWYGVVWAVDGETGKIVWWSSHFKKLAEKFNELIQWQVDSNRFTLTLAGDALLVVSVNLDKMNNQEPFRLSSVDPATGKKNWSSESGPLSNWAFIGSPIVVDSTIYVTAHPKDNQEIHLLALTREGKLLWESKLGQPQIANNWRGMPVYPLPVLKYSGGMLYVVTNNGAVIAFDTVGKSIDWAYSFETPPPMNQNGYYNQVESNEPPASAWMQDGILYFKDKGGSKMFALDVAGPVVKWSYAVGADTGIVGFDEKNFYTLTTGQKTSLNVVDLQNARMLKSYSLPDAGENIRARAAGGSFLVFLSRGIFAVDTTSGVEVKTPIFRGIDKDALGGALLRTGDKLISVSNLAVTAYPVAAGARAGK